MRVYRWCVHFQEDRKKKHFECPLLVNHCVSKCTRDFQVILFCKVGLNLFVLRHALLVLGFLNEHPLSSACSTGCGELIHDSQWLWTLPHAVFPKHPSLIQLLCPEWVTDELPFNVGFFLIVTFKCWLKL